MRIAAVTMAYRDEKTIKGTLSCLSSFVDKHIVMINERPYFGENEPGDRTEDICREFNNVDIIKGFWEEHTLRNIGIRLCSDCDWVIGFDADEMMTKEDMGKLIDYLSKCEKDAVGFISKVYWRTTDYKFNPDPDHVKVCIIRPSSSVRYYDRQCVNGSFETIDYRKEPYITHHHLSWCEPKNILRKVLHCNHANEYNGQEWYDKYFKNWKEGDPVYQPYMTKWEAVKDPLPEELKSLL
jgi:hypothetical protein